MADQGYSRTLTFVVNDKQIKRATDRLFQSLDRIEKKLDVIAGRGRGSRTGFIEVQKQIEGTNKELALLTKTASTTQSKFNNLEKTFELFSKAVYGLNQARLIAQKGLKGLTDDARTGFLRLNKEIGKTYLMLDPKKRVQLGGQFKDLIEYRSMQGAGPGSPQFRNDGRLRGSGYSTRKSLAGIGGDGPYSFMYPVNTGGFGGNTFRYEMNKRLALRQQGLERGGTGFASFSRDATYESAWQREFRARLQDQVDRRNFNQGKNLQLQTARLSEAGGGVASGASLRIGASDPVAKSIRRHREKMDKLRKVELKTTKQLLGTEKQIVAVKKTQAIQVNATAYAPGAIGPRQSLYNRLGFGAAANPQGVFANSRGIAGRRANAVSSGLIGGFFPLLFGQGGMAAGAGAAGGAAGGALGGAFGFAGSIAATAIAQKIQEAIDYRKAIDKLNKSIRLTGGDSEFSVRSMNALAKQLNVTKEEALQAAQSFEAFGAAARINLIQVFGDEATFNSLKNIRKTLDVLQNIDLIEKRIGKERANQALYIGLARGGLAAQKQILEDMFNLEEEEAKEKGGKLKGRRKFMATLSSMGQTLLGQGGKRNPYIAKLQEENIDDAVSDVLSKQAAATRTFNEELRRLGSQEIVEKIAGPRDALEELMDPLNQLVGLSQSVGDSFSESFRGIISGSMTAQEALANLFRRTADHFADMAARMIAEQIKMQIMGIGLKLLQPQGLAPSRGANTGGTDIYGRDFDNPAFGLPSGRSFADGGRPPVGRASIVGERGPELFVPDSAGTIIPNHAVGGANVVVNVDASGTAVKGDSGQAEQLGSMLAEAVQAELVKQQRPGGILARSR